MGKNVRRVGLATVAIIALALTAMPALAGKVEIIRDEYGVPHVYGANLKSTWYGVGYAMCQDRLWQAEVLRRLGTGTQAEIFGPSALAGDVVSRLVFGNQSTRAELFDRASKTLRKVYTWYALGVNACIEDMKATGTLPIEYGGLDLPPPRPWTVDDSIAVSMALLNNFGEAGADEIDHLTDLQTLVQINGAAAGGAIFFDTHILSDPTAFTTVPASAAALTASGGTVSSIESLLGSVPDINGKIAGRRLEAAFKGFRRNAERAGLVKGPASNAIAIGKKLSASGRALLLHGPQMGYSTPQINHEIGIHGGGYNVTGMTIAGIPAITIGVNRKIAWTLTSGGTDNNDLYLEQLSGGQYVFGGGLRPLDCRPEVFGVAGAPDVTRVLCETIHGPLVADVGGGVAFSLKSATRGIELESVETLHGAMKAGRVRAVDRALSQAAHNFNVLFADVRGNIGYRHAGKIPVRAPGDSPWFPHIGAGIAEWQGFVPFDQMPHVMNPDQGWLTSWNNKPAAGWRNSTRGFWQWGPVARVRTLTNVLERLPPGSATVDTIELLNFIGGHTTDSPSGNASTVVVSSLLADLVGHVDAGADPRLAGVLSMLSSWNTLQLDLNLDGRYDNPAVAIFNTWWNTFTTGVFADDLGPAYERNIVANLAGRLIKSGLLPLLHDYLEGETVGGAVTGALIAALDSLESEYGTADMSEWLQPAVTTTWEPIGAAGVPDTPWMNRGTYNQITRLARGGGMYAQNVIAPGQSGNPFSPHFADQLFNYASWQYKEMRLTRAAAVANAESIVELNATK